MSDCSAAASYDTVRPPGGGVPSRRLAKICPCRPRARRHDGAPALNVAVLGIHGTGLAYVLYYRLINDLGPTTASFVVYLVPLFGVLGGYISSSESKSACTPRPEEHW
ncbi:hypothetical protein BH18ACT15_BH18ACT15_09760 [soil metagenome]